ncbi:MAG: rubredoxin [Candidatus Woesearchaeota archaeon]|jgi:rubredoxin|nr:rubredoxin [Candidatus Woesearchaeota archaeon]
MVKWLCIPCGYVYDENIGDIDSGIEAGTKWSDIPDSWVCPICGVSKSDKDLWKQV